MSVGGDQEASESADSQTDKRNKRNVLRVAVLRAFFIAALAGGLIAGIAYIEDRDATDTDEPEADIRFSKSSCDFEVPLGVDVECGHLPVPEDWDNPDDPRNQIRLPVAVFHTRNRNPLPDPVVFLAGGPGDSLTDQLGIFTYTRRVAPFLANRDVVVFDQRGTGAAAPSLDCDELYGDFGEFEEPEETQSEPPTTDEVLAERIAAIRDCQAPLEDAGIDLTKYTTTNIARDVETLRIALGYDQWNLWGVSYGTKVALFVMRDYPDGVRSVVLDSAYPPEFNAYVERSANLDRALREVFKECEESSRCSARYKDLGGSFAAVVVRLERSPVDVVLDPEFDSYTVRVDDAGFVGALHGMLYSAEAIRGIPEMIDSANDGDFYSAAYQIDGSGDGFGIAYGMHLSVQCSGEFKLASEEEIKAGVDAYPTLRSYVELEIGVTESACRRWPGDPEPRDDEPIASNIPALVLAGQFDPTTPPSWGLAVAKRMDRSFFVEFPGQGHGVGTSGECPFEIADAFLARPRTKPDTSCVARMRAEFD